jgi:hypothetical protein
MAVSKTGSFHAGRAASVLHQAAPIVVGLGPVLAWALAYGECRALRASRAYLSASLWGLLLLASFVAWGALVVRLLGTRNGRHGWGFHAAVGMSLSLAVFGALACARLVSTTSVLLWCASGPLALGVHLGLRARRRSRVRSAPSLAHYGRRLVRRLLRPRQIVFAAGIAIFYAMAALQYAEAVANSSFNPWDDDGSYRAFPRQFLETGTLYQPFSYRRIGAYGGQSLLHAMVLAGADRERLHILDNGICAIVMLGLVTGFRARSRAASRVGILAAGLLAMTLPHTPHNLGSELSGVVLFLALFRLFDDPSFESAPTRSNAILAGLLSAGACTLRQNYLSAGVSFAAILYAALVAFPGAKPRVAWVRQGAATLGAIVCFLSPWLVLSIMSARTALYPLVQGNMTAGFGIVGRVSWDELLRWSLANLFMFKPIVTLALFFFAAFLIPFARRARAIHAMMFANIVAFALMMHFFQNFDDADSIARYYLAFTVAFAIAATLKALGDVPAVPLASLAVGGAAMAAAAVGMQFVSSRSEVLSLLFARVTSLRTVLTQRGADPEPGGADVYRRMQESVPPETPILATVDRAYLLDGRRNTLFYYDHPGAMGPVPGPPCFQGAEAFARYMHSVGVRYVAYELGPSSVEYSWDIWRRRAAADPPANGRGGFYKNQARFELDYFDVVTSLSSTRKSLFREGDFRVLDLESAAR